MGLITSIFGSKSEKTIKKKAKKKAEDGKAGLSSNFTIEEITKERVCELLEIHDLQGPLVSLIKCRKLVCEWASRLGEKGLTQRRGFMLGQLRQVEGVCVVERDPQET